MAEPDLALAEEPGATGAAGAPGRGSLLGVRVQPGASRPGIAGTWNGLVRVAVHAPPQDGRANAETITVLAQALGLRASELALVRGERSRQKTVRLPISVDEARRRLSALLG